MQAVCTKKVPGMKQIDKRIATKRSAAMLAVALIGLLLSACGGVPDGIRPVAELDLQRYAGRWYELARYDHRFERGMSHVTADYTLLPSGKVAVVNRGYLQESGQWKSADGKARWAAEPGAGHLEVSFFGPFYADYVVFYLSDDYQQALVTGPSRDYFWMLSRTPQISDKLWRQLSDIAQRNGFSPQQWIVVKQDNRPEGD